MIHRGTTRKEKPLVSFHQGFAIKSLKKNQINNDKLISFDQIASDSAPFGQPGQTFSTGFLLNDPDS